MSSGRRQRDLAGRVALVVGGGRNMGAAFAERIAARGATTVISYAGAERSAEDTLARLEAHEVTAEAIRSDATRSDAIDELFLDVATRHLRLDIVVSVPGAVMKKPLAEHTDDDFDHLVDLNLRSVFNTLRAAGRHLADNGRYVALSTALTVLPASPYGMYAASKAAVERLVFAAARELGGRGITVNAVAPGPVDDFFFHATETPEAAEGARHLSPSNRLGRIDDIAPVVDFLVGEQARWVNGQAIRVNGGAY